MTTLLSHDDPIVREEAIALLLSKWEIAGLRDTARRMLRSDEDTGVRARTALGLASISTPLTRADDAALIAEAFHSPSAPPTVKLACVEALSLLTGRPAIAEQDDLSPKAVQRLLAEIASMGP